MNIPIKKFFAIITFILSLIGLSIMYLVLILNDYSVKLKSAEYNRYIMFKKADELRQSSDDLSRLANKYVITSNISYKEDYYTALAIRNGKAKRPLEYSGVYWDLSKELREKNHPLGKRISLKTQMKQLPYIEYELDRLKISENQSNNLVNLEIEAFNAMNGLFKDTKGKYTIKGNPNQKLAISLINSLEYDSIKEKIMLPIDELLKSINSRTTISTNKYHKKIKNTFNSIFILMTLGIVLLVCSIILIIKKILIPISSLSNNISNYKTGNTHINEKIYYDDEIGIMTKHLFNVEKISLIDYLTKLNNRKSYTENIEKLITNYRRYKTPFSILTYDIDNFKQINDKYGHRIGDAVLIEMSKLIKSHIRDSDHIFRIGGEEFIILLNNTQIDKAKLVAEKIRYSVEHNLKTIKDKTITISIGLTEVKENDTEDSIFQRADKYLYMSKNSGKNKTTVMD